MNILILSAGTRNKIVEYFVKTLAGNGKVVATDMSKLAPAIYEADKYYIVPKMTDPEYMDIIFDILLAQTVKVLGVVSKALAASMVVLNSVILLPLLSNI